MRCLKLFALPLMLCCLSASALQQNPPPEKPTEEQQQAFQLAQAHLILILKKLQGVDEYLELVALAGQMDKPNPLVGEFLKVRMEEIAKSVAEEVRPSMVHAGLKGNRKLAWSASIEGGIVLVVTEEDGTPFLGTLIAPTRIQNGNADVEVWTPTVRVGFPRKTWKPSVPTKLTLEETETLRKARAAYARAVRAITVENYLKSSGKVTEAYRKDPKAKEIFILMKETDVAADSVVTELKAGLIAEEAIPKEGVAVISNDPQGMNVVFFVDPSKPLLAFRLQHKHDQVEIKINGAEPHFFMPPKGYKVPVAR